jgi:hypothetical protein
VIGYLHDSLFCSDARNFVIEMSRHQSTGFSMLQISPYNSLGPETKRRDS